MSADVLRAAAKLMRERANDATPGAWRAFSAGTGRDVDWYVVSEPYGQVATGAHTENGLAEIVLIERDHRDAEHIASWRPLVALAVADWLENEAKATEIMTDERDEESGASILGLPDKCAVAVARAYLGTS